MGETHSDCKGLILVVLSLLAGVIDRDYRGNVGVVMFNLSKEKYQGQYRDWTETFIIKYNTVHKGDRIAQLVLERILIAEIEEVDVSLLMSMGNHKLFIIILLELGLDRERCRRFWINREKLTINSKAGKKDLHAYMSQEK